MLIKHTMFNQAIFKVSGCAEKEKYIGCYDGCGGFITNIKKIS